MLFEAISDRIDQYKTALEEIDSLAEAGLCQFSSGDKHEFLKDIRRVISKLEIQGGLTPAPSTDFSHLWTDEEVTQLKANGAIVEDHGKPSDESEEDCPF